MEAPYVADDEALYLQTIRLSAHCMNLKKQSTIDSIADFSDRPFWAAGTPNNLICVQTINSAICFGCFDGGCLLRWRRRKEWKKTIIN